MTTTVEVDAQHSPKRARENDLVSSSPDMFTVARIEEVLNEAGKRIDVCTLFYALHQQTLSHPEYNNGTPFTLDAYKEILSYLGRMTGGGKAMFKIAASLKASRFGKPPSKATVTVLRKAGFSLAKKARVETDCENNK